MNFDETQSESNWSTDVLGSDTEKPSEVEYDGSSKPLDLPSPDSIFYDSQSSIREQKASNNFSRDQLFEPASNIKPAPFDGPADCLFNDGTEDISKSFGITVNNKSDELKAELTNDEIKELEHNAEVNIIRSDSNITNPFFNEDEALCDFTVQHRRNVTVQRNSNFDSRRNGMLHADQLSISSKQSDGLLLDFISNSKPDTLNVNGKSARSSSGAIPKSISFDATADKNEQYSPSKRGGIFNKIKGFANMKGRRSRVNVEQPQLNEKHMSKSNENEEKVFLVETTDDILGKYRRKVSTSSDPASSESAGSNSSSKLISVVTLNRNIFVTFNTFAGSLKSKSSKSDIMKTISSEPDFENVRRKIKMVLCRSSVPSTDFKSNCVSNC